jgi:rod shape determining protein RodA
MSQRSIWRNFDWILFSSVLVLSGIGVSMIYSSTVNTEDLNDLWMRQLLFIGAGVIILFIVALFDYRHLELLAPPAYLVLVALLVAVLFIGETQGTGTRRWLNIAGTLVQPTELGKFLLIIFFAWYLNWYREYMDGLPYLLIALALLLIPLALIYEQPDLGTTLSFAFIGGMLIVVSGIRYWQLGLLSGGMAATVPLLVERLEGYMQARIDVFLDPATDPAATYNIEQAKIAIGSGGWLGQGWGHGSQNQLHFLRVRHTDFIFSVMAEELGLIGAALIIALLLFVIWRILDISQRTEEPFGRLLAVGAAALIFFQTMVSIGMNLNLLPVTGLPLPFISYGGSSLITMMFAVGLAQSVAMRHRKMEFF